MASNRFHLNQNKKPVIIGYFGIPGRDQPIKYLLELFKVPYEFKVHNSEEWFGKEKNSIDLNFPNLPYLIDGNIRLTETINISNYIISKYGKGDIAGRGDDKYLV